MSQNVANLTGIVAADIPPTAPAKPVGFVKQARLISGLTGQPHPRRFSRKPGRHRADRRRRLAVAFTIPISSETFR